MLYTYKNSNLFEQNEYQMGSSISFQNYQFHQNYDYEAGIKMLIDKAPLSISLSPTLKTKHNVENLKYNHLPNYQTPGREIYYDLSNHKPIMNDLLIDIILMQEKLKKIADDLQKIEMDLVALSIDMCSEPKPNNIEKYHSYFQINKKNDFINNNDNDNEAQESTIDHVNLYTI